MSILSDGNFFIKDCKTDRTALSGSCLLYTSPKLTIETGLKMGAIAVGCAVISIVFCMVLNGVAGAYEGGLRIHMCV